MQAASANDPENFHEISVIIERGIHTMTIENILNASEMLQSVNVLSCGSDESELRDSEIE